MIEFEDVPAVETLIADIKKAAELVNSTLFGHTDESHFQKALEIVLRGQEIRFEVERIFPVTIEGTALRDVRNEIDLLAYVDLPSKSKGVDSICLVVELKVNGDEEAACTQALRYVLGVHRANTRTCAVYHRALVLNFRASGQCADFELKKRKIEDKIDALRRERISVEKGVQRHEPRWEERERSIRNSFEALVSTENRLLESLPRAHYLEPTAVLPVIALTPTVRFLPKELLS